MKRLLFLVPLTGWLLISCEPTPDDFRLYDQMVVYTNYDTTAQFDSYTTYAIPTDTIGFISNVIRDDTIIVGSKYAAPVINAVKGNLNKRGFQQTDRDNDPDLAVNVYVVRNLDIYQQLNYYYPGYYYPGYYGYSGYYYGYPTVSTYANNSAVLVIELVDLKNITPLNEVKVIWNATMGDVFSVPDATAQSTGAIDQAFLQSPYIIKQQ